MAPYNITVDDEILKGLFTGDRGVAQLLEKVLNQVLNAQASEQLQAEPYERSEERQGYRNGTRPHPRGHAHIASATAEKWSFLHRIVCTLSAQ